MQALQQEQSHEAIKHDFLNFVDRTGKPHEWGLLTKSTPPKDVEFQVITKFVVKREFRGKVERTPCPVCRPNNPKYYEGYLVYFPIEDVYRAIGHVCGVKHFGAEFDRQVDVVNKAASDQKAIDFLLSALPKLGALAKTAEALLERNTELDQLLARLNKNLSKAIVRRMAKEGAAGVLTIYDELEIPTTGFGSEGRSKRQFVATHQFRFAGSSFLSSHHTGASWAQNALRVLEPLLTTDDEIPDVLVNWSGILGRCAEVKEQILNALSDLESANRFAQGAVEFFNEDSFDSLHDWTSHSSCPLAKVRAGIDSYGRFVISVQGQKQQFSCERGRACISDPIPTLPDLA